MKVESLAFARMEALNKIQGGTQDGKSGKAAEIEKVRSLQEFYKNLIQAYFLFPDDPRFGAYAKSAPGLTSLEKEFRAVFSSDFLKVLEGESAQINGARVGFVLFRPEPKLHAIFNEYVGRLGRY